MDRPQRGGGGGGGSGGNNGGAGMNDRDLRERYRDGDNRDADAGYGDRRVGMGGGSIDYRNVDVGNGRGEDRVSARDRDRGYDARAVSDRYEVRDVGASRYAEPSRYRLGGNILVLVG